MSSHTYTYLTLSMITVSALIDSKTPLWSFQSYTIIHNAYVTQYQESNSYTIRILENLIAIDSISLLHSIVLLYVRYIHTHMFTHIENDDIILT